MCFLRRRSGQSPNVTGEPASSDPYTWDSLLPPLSSLSELATAPRQSSVDELLTVEGDAFLSSNLTSAVPETALAFNSLPGQLAFAVYEFALPQGAENIAAVLFEVTGLQSESPVSMAIANFSVGRWEHLTLEAHGTAGQQLADFTQRAPADYSSSSGSCFVALLAYDGFSLTLDKVQLLTGTPLLPPQSLTSNGTAIDDTFAGRIDLKWEAVSGADGYDLFTRRVADGPDAPFDPLVSVDGEQSTSFSHSLTDPPGLPCPYGELMEYKVRSRQGAEVSSLFSPLATGLRSVRPPLQLSAADQTNTHNVRLSWTAEDEAVSYQLRRDALDGPVIYEGPDLTFSDFFVDDPSRHDYFVSSVCSEGLGLFARQADAPAGTIEWLRHDIPVVSTDNPILLDAARVAGRPAFICRLDGALSYARATKAEPAAAGDWVFSEIAPACGDQRPRLVEHQGKPWVVYADADQLPRMAHASVGLPDDSGDWTSYALPGAEVGAVGFAMTDVNHLLKLLVPDPAASGGALLLLSATIEEPADANAWLANLIDPAIANSACFEIREIGEGTSVLLEDNADLRYLHTGVIHPGPADWVSMMLPKVDNQGVIQAVDLLPGPSGHATGLYRFHIGNMTPAANLGYVYTSVQNPLSGDDWALVADPLPASLALEGTLGYLTGRPLIPRSEHNTVISVQQALAFPPQNEDAGWDKYEVHLDADPRQVRTRICLLDFGGRPAMFYETRDQANTQHAVTYARVQPKL